MSDGGRTEAVVTGAGVLHALADDLEGFAAALRAGRSAVRAAGESAEPGGPDGAPAGARLDGFSLADWASRRLPDDPETAARLRAVAGRAALPAQTAACAALAAVHDAGLGPSDLDGAALIVAGNNLALDHQAQMVRTFATRPGRLRPSYALTHMDTDTVGVISEVTGVRGEGWTAGAASASGTVAVILGSRLVRSGDASVCLVVAPATDLSAAELRAFRDSGAMADTDGVAEPWLLCRPFDQRRKGFVYGQGAAAIVLESADHADRRGARALARIAGHGQRLDGRRGTAPDAQGQATALRAALAHAGVGPQEVDYVNAHGTGSVAGDAAEAHALLDVFGPDRHALVNSTKPLLGHCLTSAGLLELVATLIQMREHFRHGNPNTEQPLAEELPLVGRSAAPGPVRVALCHSVAFSGINAAVVLRR
ncbi:beta-ketoacyl synthase N-terminal-like domain-containing protein [Streptomyces sp. NPDC057798]|uniref:beta-ketoacyl synthase N-terminal-like domain-containing protein n=1 Tax=Streptomyces sp. NPDC057798 TaxID=3346252 RepID=UPI00369CC475